MVEVSTKARVGLLGNPSDGYGGRVLAFTIADFAATVTAVASPVWDCGDSEGSALIEAGITGLVGAGVSLPQPAQMRFSTTIPRQVGLSGSSAIVISAMRAALALNDQTLPPVQLAQHALLAETEALGITAGPQDRVVQAYGGFVDMDFATDWNPGAYHRLASELVPAGLFIAWDREPGEDSGQVHRDVASQWRDGDMTVRTAIARFGEFAAAGRAAIEAGDRAAVADLMDANFDTRSQLWPIAPSDLDKIAIARSHGAGGKFCGSGGAVVGVPRDLSQLAALQASYEQAGFAFLQPTAEGSQA